MDCYPQMLTDHRTVAVAVARFSFVLFNKSLNDWSVPRETVHFVSLEFQCFPRLCLGETLRFSGNNEIIKLFHGSVFIFIRYVTTF